MATHGHTPHVNEHADSWHHHSTDEGVPQHEHAGVASPLTLFRAFIVIAASVAIVVVGLKMYFTYAATNKKALSFESNKLAQEAVGRKAGWAVELKTAAPLGEKGFRIPIDVAMDKTVARYSGGAKATPAK